VVEALLDAGSTHYFVWLGILICLTQSAMFSGLNLACFSVSRLRLEIEVANGNAAAKKVLALRRDSNFLLTTVLWGNVGINVLLTLLSNSAMLGLSAFMFSTVAITLGGEIFPQAYFSRNALRMASFLAPVLRTYQVLLYIIAKPSALLLDLWLGREGIQYLGENDLRQLIHKHIDAAGSDVDAVEGIGALNFLAIDDVHVSQEGEAVGEASVLHLSFDDNEMPEFFQNGKSSQQGFACFNRQIASINFRWVIVVDDNNYPQWALDGDAYLRAAYTMNAQLIDPFEYCHRPVVVTNSRTRMGAVIALLKSGEAAQSDAPIPHKIILLWNEEKRIITGADILGRLFKGIGLYSAIEERSRRQI